MTIAIPREALMRQCRRSLAVMVRPVDGADELVAFLADKRHNAVVLGPGGGVGPGHAGTGRRPRWKARRAVLDADALTSFADEPATLAGWIAQRAGGNVVLTPHEGEFARLFRAIHDANSDKLENAVSRQGSKAIVLLKGPDTVVAAPDGRASISENAPA